MDKAKILSSIQRQCARRETCSQDVRLKVRRMLGVGHRSVEQGHPSPEEPAGEADLQALAEELLRSLRKDGYVDDARYAACFAREKASVQGWGTAKIRMALQRKGIASDVVQAALEEIDGERSQKRLEALVRQKARSLTSDPARRQKLLRYLLSRGYSWEEALSAAESAFVEGD